MSDALEVRLGAYRFRCRRRIVVERAKELVDRVPKVDPHSATFEQVEALASTMVEFVAYCLDPADADRLADAFRRLDDPALIDDLPREYERLVKAVDPRSGRLR